MTVLSEMWILGKDSMKQRVSCRMSWPHKGKNDYFVLLGFF